MDNRPIKGNPSGKYDMSFIDPTNDIAAYYNSPPQLQQLIEVSYEPNKPIRMTDYKYRENVGYIETCSVCTQGFKKGEIIGVLICGHAFHRYCVEPWFQKHDKCPNCRFNLRE